VEQLTNDAKLLRKNYNLVEAECCYNATSMHDLRFKLDNENIKYTILIKKHKQEIYQRDQRESDFQAQIDFLKKKDREIRIRF
ncbi:35083_t:CDS:2, partial [Racocetra persica]